MESKSLLLRTTFKAIKCKREGNANWEKLYWGFQHMSAIKRSFNDTREGT